MIAAVQRFPNPLLPQTWLPALRLCILAAGVLVGVGWTTPVAAQGMPNLTYTADQVGTVLARVDAALGAPRGHGSLMLHRGYLTVIFSRDSGKGDGGFAFFDITDPALPTLVHSKDDEETEDIREAHGFGVVRFEGRDLFFIQASFGVQIWDFTDVRAPSLVHYLRLPGITDSDYGTGAWFAFPQWPYLYLGGSSNGVYVIDIHDPTAPFLVDRAGQPNPIPPTLLGGFKTGPVYAAGSLLTVTGMDQPGFSTADISDPEQPRLLNTRSQGLDSVYSGLFNGGLLYGAGTQGHVTVYDVRDPTRILDYSRSPRIEGRGGYLSVQDGVAHVGQSVQFVAVDFNQPDNPQVILAATGGVEGRDEDFATVLGNLTFVSDDHGNGSFIIPHQAAPDTTPPVVNFLSPASGAVGQSLDTRVGVTFSDAIDFQSVTEQTFQLRVAGGEAVPGYFSYQQGVLNFGPREPLLPDTTYELEIPAGGIRDVAGNPLVEPVLTLFSTGQLAEHPNCRVESSGPAEAGAEVSFELSATGDAFAWDFGDGQRSGAPTGEAAARHTYAEPGHYSVVAYVYRASVLATTCVLTQTVHREVVGRAPRSGTFALDDPAERLWVTNQDHATVSVIDLSNGSLLAELEVPEEPRSVALGQNPKTGREEAWVVSDAGRSLSIFDSQTYELLSSLKFPWGSRPSAVLLSSAGPGYVSLRGTERVLELDRATYQVSRELELEGEPWGMSLDAEAGELYVARFISARDHGSVSVVNTASFSLDRSVRLLDDPGPDTENGGRGVPNYLRSVLVAPDRSDVWVVGKKDNTSRGWWQDGLPLTHESTVRAIAARIGLGVGDEDPSRRLDLDDRNLPSAVELSPLGNIAFVATQGSNTVEVLDAYSGRPITSIDGATQAPEGVLLDPSGTRLYVHGFLSRSVAVYDVANLVTAGSNRAEPLSEFPTVSREVLPESVLAGARMFYDSSDPRMSRDNYLSCASCHLDGEHDGRVWDFSNRGEGLRNTTTLRGKRGGQGRLHWSANFDEVQDFEHDIREAFGGSGFIDQATFEAGLNDPLGAPKAGASPELDQLASYLQSLDRVPDSPFRTQTGEPTRAALRGAAHFERLECSSCHAGPDYTNSSDGELYDVGSLTTASGSRLTGPLTGIDTPTLVGLWATAPYLHDGSAETVEALLERAAASGKHGDVASLSAPEREELAAFLLQLDHSVPEPSPAANDPAGCGCAVPTREPTETGRLMLGLGLALLLKRRRRTARS